MEEYSTNRCIEIHSKYGDKFIIKDLDTSTGLEGISVIYEDDKGKTTAMLTGSDELSKKIAHAILSLTERPDAELL